VSKAVLKTQVVSWLSYIGISVDTCEIEILSRSVGSEVIGVYTSTGTREHNFVIRRVLSADWLRREPNLVLREAKALDLVESLPFSTPKLISIDAEGRWFKSPAVLTEMLPGRPWLSGRKPGEKEIMGLADWLKLIHNARLIDEAVLCLPPYRPHHWPNALSMVPPKWSLCKDAWITAARIARQCYPLEEQASVCLLHRDYRMENLLWNNQSPVAVIDWITACYGDPGADVGHCRWNLCHSWGQQAMELFTVSYGCDNVHPVWDLLAAIGGLPDMKPELTLSEINNLDAFITQAIDRCVGI
tara:strand:+ start:651 stop:1553 length:903 start_codon:yes stop_codon:yes gene_type:complete